MVLFAASHLENAALLYAPAVLATQWGAIALAAEALPDAGGAWAEFLPWLAGAGSASVVLYAVRLIRVHALDAAVLGTTALDANALRAASVSGVPAGAVPAGAVPSQAPGRGKAIPVRRWSLARGAFLGLLLVAVAGIKYTTPPLDGRSGLAAAVVIAYREARPEARRIALELSALVLTAAVQRAAIFALDGLDGPNGRWLAGLPDPFWVAQWYVLLGAVLGGCRYVSGHRRAGRILVGAAAALLSVNALGVVFGGTGAHQLWVLVLLAVLLVAGLASGALFVWWGAGEWRSALCGPCGITPSCC